jgi:hypothetical protein
MGKRSSLVFTVATMVLAGVSLFALAGCTKEKSTPGRPHTRAASTTVPAGEVVNARCPILGNKLDRADVPDSLVRMFEGKKVGFCCAGCPEQWDKLSDTDKAKKLEAAMK